MESGAKIMNASGQVIENGIIKEKPLIIGDLTPSSSAPAQEKVQIQPVVQEQPVAQSVKSGPDINQINGDLSQLVNVGKIQEEVKLFGFNIKMVTLSAEENTDILEKTVLLEDDTARFNELKYAILAKAIKSVNGMTLEQLYAGPEVSNKARAVIGKWQQLFINMLFDKYNGMVERSEEALKNGDLLKN